ncbi:MAG: FAD-dependent thymidylate synthase [Selenomonadaceae bacterium]|nr:FAD-dependent thymidylate synthase [Selenomonadaceae bacterium]
MKIIEPSVELIDDFDAAAIMQKLERAGRVCYKSEGNIKDGSAEKFIRGIIKRGHESVIEHASVSFKIVCDRGVTHELVRHRIASYCVTGDTIIPSYISDNRRSAKKRTIETIYNWFLDAKCHAAVKQLVVRSFDEQTHSIVPNKIKNVFFNGTKDVFEITTESGRTLKCTDGHRFFTDDGWKTLGELESGNFIYVNGLPYLENEEWLRHNYLTLNKTRKQLAEEIGCSESRLYKAFKKFGITKPLSDRPNRHPGHGVKGMFSDEQRADISERMSGEKNHRYLKNRNDLSVSGGYRESRVRFSAAACKCEYCGSDKNIEIHHLDKNPRNNDENNVKFLCSKCHHLWHRPYAVGAFRDKIQSITYVGKEKVYDLEMELPYQNYVANSIIVHNSQESSRFCDYSAGKFGGELTFIKPCFWREDDDNFQLWRETMALVEKNYLALRAAGAKPEEARSILPNSLKTEIFVTMNLRELRHFLKLRTAAAAHPQMREIALKILDMMLERLPAVFDDIQP